MRTPIISLRPPRSIPKYHSDIIPDFNAHMNKWTFDRLNRVEQAILLLGYIHYFHIEEVDKGVVIDIAVRLESLSRRERLSLC